VSTLRMSQVPLRTAIEKISQLYKIDILFADVLVEKKRVSFELSNLPAEKALVRLLKSTSLVFRRRNKNLFVLYNKNQANRMDISGRVTDAQSGEVLPFANIRIVGSYRGTTSNAMGRFTLLRVPAKFCTVNIEYIGYASKDTVLEATNLTPNLLINLNQSPLRFSSITVHAKSQEIVRISNDVSQLAISPRGFSNLPVVGDKDIFRSLQLMPGIETGLNGSSGINIQGGASSNNLVLLDGMTLYHIDHAFGLFSAFNNDAIEDIRIYKGAYPAQFGGRVGGILELTSKSGDFNKPKLNIGISGLSAQSILQLPLQGKGAFMLSARTSHKQNSFYKLYDKLYETPPFLTTFLQFARVSSAPPGVDSRTGVNIGPSQTQDTFYNSKRANNSFHDILAKITLSPTDRTFLNMSLFTSSDKSSASGLNQITLTVDQQSRWESAGLSTKIEHHWNSTLNSTGIISASQYSTDFEEKSLNPVANSTLNEPFPINTGIDTLITNYRNNLDDFTIALHNSWLYGPLTEVRFGGDMTQTRMELTENFLSGTIQNSSSEKLTLSSFYIQNKLGLIKYITFTTGFRYVYNDLRQDTYFEPRFSLKVQPISELVFKGGWGSFHQFILNYGNEFQYFNRQMPWILANNDGIEPSSSEHLTGGIQWQNETYLLDIEAYHKKTDGIIINYNQIQINYDSALIDTTSGSVFITPDLIQGRSVTEGLDLILQKKSGVLTGWLAYSYVKSTQTQTRFGLPVEYPTDHEIPHSLKLVWSHQRNALTTSVIWRWSSGRPYTMPDFNDYDSFYLYQTPEERNQYRLPATQNLDVSMTYALKYKSVKGRIGLSIFNILNTKNVWYRHFSIENDTGRLRENNIYMLGRTASMILELALN